MALVPFRASGPAASQQLEQQLLQVGPYCLVLRQRPLESGNTAHLQQPYGGGQGPRGLGTDARQQPQQQEEGQQGRQQQQQQQRRLDLSNVGLVLWQSGYVLADFLLLRLPELQPGAGCWPGARVLELGCGAGTVGLFLALAGAQVVLTDQRHILPLTSENLEACFPASAALGSDGQAGEVQRAEGGPAAAAQEEAAAAAAAAPLSSVDATAAAPQPPQRRPPSVADALAAAFCLDAAAAAPPPPDISAEHALAPRPLAVPYSWGEPAEQLRQRTAAAAAARWPDSAGDEGAAAGAAAATTSRFFGCLDFVVGADLLYDPAAHGALLSSLGQLAAPHTQVWLCHRQRGLGEGAFEEAAEAAGWLVEAVPCGLLHPEFRGGEYRLLRLCRLG